MADKYHDDKIAADFRRLREVERNAAPTFERLLSPQTGSQPRRGFLQPARLALAASAVLLAVVILLNPNRNGRSVDSVIESNHKLDDIQLTLVDEMPTDFLLDTPWFQLASTTPQFQLLTPSYEFLEEISDEL